MLGKIWAIDPRAGRALSASYQRAVAAAFAPAEALPSFLDAPGSLGAIKAGRPWDAAGSAGEIAVIQISGFMTKPESAFEKLLLRIFGGTDTGATRAAIESAAASREVQAVVLHINSPGGTWAGTGDLADAVANLRDKKPVVSVVEDLGASAAYYVASQSGRVFVNASGLVGSIGVYSVLIDESGAADAAGVKVHVISSGGVKGGGVPGAPIEPAVLGESQRLVDGMTSMFVDAVARGRDLPQEHVAKWADGRVHFAGDALVTGMVDEVGSVRRAIYHAGLEVGLRAAAADAAARAAKGAPLTPVRVPSPPPRAAVTPAPPVRAADPYSMLKIWAAIRVERGQAATLEQGLAQVLRTAEGLELYEQYRATRP